MNQPVSRPARARRGVPAAVAGALAAFMPATCLAQGYIVSTVAGGSPYITSVGNGQPATNAFLNSPAAVAVDGAGNLYIADTANNTVRKVTAATGIISAFAGTGAGGFSGDGGAATSAQLHEPGGIAVDSAGNVYIADTANNRIRKVNTSGVITTVAGSANVSGGRIGDGGPATSAILNFPRGVLPDSSGNLYIADTGSERIRKVDTSGNIITVAGIGTTGMAGMVGDGGPATSAQLNSPVGLAFDSAGNLYIADTGDNLIRKVSNGTITSIAGNGEGGYTGDGNLAAFAALNQPQGVAVDGAGHVFISDTVNNVIRVVSSSDINTVAGNGNVGSTGDGGPAGAATFYSPSGIAMTSSGLIYIADAATGYKDARIRLLTPASGTSSAPSILNNGIVPVFSSTNTIAPGEWITIYGTNLASSTVTWDGTFPIPTSLGQVAVTIDSLQAFLWYVSPTQINAQVPNDTNTGVAVVTAVSTPAGNAFEGVNLSQYAPSFSLFSSKYPAAIVYTPGSPGNSGAGYDNIGPANAFSFPSRPVAAGETVVLYGVGFGPTVPAIPAGQAPSAAAPLATLPTVMIGNAQATVNFGGIVEAGLYQFNVVAPAAGSGDQALVATVNGVTTQSNIFLTLK